MQISVKSKMDLGAIKKDVHERVSLVTKAYNDKDVREEVAFVVADISAPYVPYSNIKDPEHTHLADSVDFDYRGVYYNGVNEKNGENYTRKAYYKQGIKRYNKRIHPLATDRWDKVAIAENRKEFNREVARIIRAKIRELK